MGWACLRIAVCAASYSGFMGTALRDLTAYRRLTNFCQNHRAFAASRTSFRQLGYRDPTTGLIVPDAAVNPVHGDPLCKFDYVAIRWQFPYVSGMASYFFAKRLVWWYEHWSTKLLIPQHVTAP